MLKSYNVADIYDDTFCKMRMYIVAKIEGDFAWVIFVRRDLDHGGLMQRVPVTALLNVRTADLLA